MKEAPYEMWKDFEALDFYQQVNNKGTEHSIEYCYWFFDFPSLPQKSHISLDRRCWSSDGSDEDQEANIVPGFKGANAAQNRFS